MEEIEPLGMGDTPLLTTDKEAVEKLIADVKAPKKKNIRRKILSEKDELEKSMQRKHMYPSLLKRSKLRRSPCFKALRKYGRN